MAKKDTLTNAAVQAAKPRTKPYKLFDGGGLYLLIRPDGSRYWRFKYRIDGTEKLISLGVYPEVPLASRETVDRATGKKVSMKGARELRNSARQLVRDRIDPSEQRKVEKANRRTAAENTFEAVAREWFAKKSRTWAKNNADKVIGRLEKDVFPEIGRDPISKLTGPKLLEVLRVVEKRGAIESAHRIRQYINSTFRYAIQTHRVQANPTPHPEALTPPTKGKFASITDTKGVGALIRAIRGYQGTHVVTMALRLAPLVFARPGEIRAAEWAEFDLDAAEWMIPADRTKMRRPHLVPLSAQAVEILREIHKVTGTVRYVFPSERSNARPLSENTLNAALRSLGYSTEQMTTHGFRHMASTLLHESRKWRSEVIERQLAHADRNSIRAVYNAAEYLPERRELMQWWADRLDSLAAADNVVNLRTRG
ncbi:MAG TPA: integrase arm-type DNA-binding domain-containing protein [Steroidobacteraceae bacterium]|nr:integrase arm-type DNA-binding domain-containing protein [Steroidobacteraceae bacterium]